MNGFQLPNYLTPMHLVVSCAVCRQLE